MSTTVLAERALPRLAWLDRLRHKPVRLALAGLLALCVVAVAGVLFGTVAVAPGDTLAILAHRLLGLPVTVTWPASAETTTTCSGGILK